MAELTYKPNGSSSPDRKQNVYIACHPKDIVLLDDIANDIYRYQNCAIWYDSKPLDAFDEGDYLNQLKERMQLFVVPITTRFLLEDNRARDLELGFALRNSIPVLPLMLESGLEVPFKEHCGDLQFLDKTSHDLTAISYDEKLKKYLASVLIGDELAEKIRKAFDAYVFLSYRKKDREYAHRLMRLIHKNEFARDIAIWYDEYLVPGEGFNDAIKQALKNSELFAMVVTPNLVNETNYVMQEEYPIAKAEGKPIIPVEMNSTDRAALEKIAPDFPRCVDVANESELSEKFWEHICAQEIAVRKNDQDPEHNLYIGLAYLNGIDVEIDHPRAVELINLSANAGNIEAQKQLVNMYQTGTGVELNYKKAAELQGKLVLRLLIGKTMQDAVIPAIIADPNIPIAPAETIPKQQISIQSIYDAMVELDKIIEYVRLNDNQLAWEAAYTAGDIEVYRSVAWQNDYSAKKAKKDHDYDSAKMYYEISLEHYKKIVDKEENTSNLNQLAQSYYNLSTVTSEREKEEYLEQSIKIWTKISRETGEELEEDILHGLAQSYYELADTVSGRSRRELLEQSLEIWSRLCEKSTSLEISRMYKIVKQDVRWGRLVVVCRFVEKQVSCFWSNLCFLIESLIESLLDKL